MGGMQCPAQPHHLQHTHKSSKQIHVPLLCQAAMIGTVKDCVWHTVLCAVPSAAIIWPCKCLKDLHASLRSHDCNIIKIILYVVVKFFYHTDALKLKLKRHHPFPHSYTVHSTDPNFLAWSWQKAHMRTPKLAACLTHLKSTYHLAAHTSLTHLKST